MSIVKFGPDGFLHGKDGKPFYLMGINYVASYICTNFWEDFRPEHIERDLKRIAAMGLCAVRIPMPWYTIEPKPGHYNEDFFPLFDHFLRICRENNLYVMPWFLVGVATQCYDYPYRNGLSYFGPEMTELAERHLQHFISRYKHEEQILCWDICDEPEFYDLCGPLPDSAPFDRRIMRRWARDCYRAIKEVDSEHIVTLGYGPIATDHNGIHIRDAADTLDCLVVTAYPNVTMEALDQMRNNYFLPYNVRMHNLGKPVFCCEAPGHTDVAYGQEVLRRYFKLSFYGGLLNRSVGFMPWVYTDFDSSLWEDVPLEGATFEPLFGVCRVDGSLKPRGQELVDFAAFAKQADLTQYRFAPAQSAIIVPPSYYTENDPVYHKVYTSFVLAQNTIGNLDLIWSDMDFSAYQLLVLPSTRGITTSTWRRLCDFVEAGGTLYVQYDNKWGLSAHSNKLFGVEVLAPEKNHCSPILQVCADFGLLKESQYCSIGRGSERVRVQPRACDVLMRFDDGVPAMICNRLGKGEVYLTCTDITGGLLMDTPNDQFVCSDCFAIYRSLALETGAIAPYWCDDLRVETGYLQGDGKRLLLCINHDVEPVDTLVHLPEGTKRVLTMDGDAVLFQNNVLQIQLKEADVARFYVEGP